MTEEITTHSQEVISYKDQCDEIQKELDNLSVKFKEHYENVMKPILPDFFVDQIEEFVKQMESKNDQIKSNFDYTDVEVLNGHKQALKTMQAFMVIYGIEV